MDRILNAIGKARSNQIYNALITESFPLCLRQAEEALNRGLTPFPVVVKDCFNVKDLKVTCASDMLKNYTSLYTSTVVDRLISKGGCVIGKSNMDEFAMGASSLDSKYGPVKNGFSPLDKIDEDWLISGGSSGGSAVAVQLGMADVGIGSDTGGSTRNPAAFCGLVGFKPSYGALSRFGLIPLVNSLDTVSIFAKDVGKTIIYFDIMRGICEKDSTSFDCPKEIIDKDRKLTIGLPKEYFTDTLTKEAKNAVNKAANILSDLGHKIVHVSMPHTEYSILCYHIINEVDVTSNMARFTGLFYGESNSNETSADEMMTKSRTLNLNSTVKRRIFAGNYFTMKKNNRIHYLEALKIRRMIFQDFQNVFANECDLLLTPVTSSTSPLKSAYLKDKVNQERMDDYYTQGANMAGVPAISIPISKAANRLPLSVQLMAGFGKDDLLLHVAEVLEKNHSLISC
uniref:Glutamyl-tRNA(Gln) amidotransferase subunit A, mitochondrial n=1 Tax=Rhabditophanes sp. KR3021 TaxID=114890 RepID=A0AC35TMG2_9BILA